MAEEKDLIEQIKGIGDTTKAAVKDAETRISKAVEEKTLAVKEDVSKTIMAEVDKVKIELDEKYNSEIISLKDELKSSKDELKAFKAEQGTDFSRRGYAVTIADAIMKELKKPENRDKIKQVRNSSTAKAMFEVEIPDVYTKAVHTMTTSDVTGGTVLLQDVEPGLVNIARRRPFLRNILSVGFTNNKLVTWIEKDNVEGGAGATGENAPKSQGSFQWAEKNIPVRKITEFIKVTTETLEDIDEAEADIREELIQQLELKFDEQLLIGDGLTTNIKGIKEWATAFNPGSLAGTIANANESDVIQTGVKVMINNNHYPTHILISPLDAGKIAMEKDMTGRYVTPPFNNSDGTRMSGVAVIENPGVTQGTAYLIDATKVKVRIRKNLGIAVGYDDDDFTNNRVTFLAELRAALYVATNNAKAVVEIDFDAAIAALESGSSS